MMDWRKSSPFLCLFDGIRSVDVLNEPIFDFEVEFPIWESIVAIEVPSDIVPVLIKILDVLSSCAADETTDLGFHEIDPLLFYK